MSFPFKDYTLFGLLVGDVKIGEDTKLGRVVDFKASPFRFADQDEFGPADLMTALRAASEAGLKLDVRDAGEPSEEATLLRARLKGKTTIESGQVVLTVRLLWDDLVETAQLSVHDLVLGEVRLEARLKQETLLLLNPPAEAPAVQEMVVYRFINPRPPYRPRPLDEEEREELARSLMLSEGCPNCPEARFYAELEELLGAVGA